MHSCLWKELGMFLSSLHSGREQIPLFSVWHAVINYKYTTWLSSLSTVGWRKSERLEKDVSLRKCSGWCWETKSLPTFAVTKFGKDSEHKVWICLNVSSFSGLLSSPLLVLTLLFSFPSSSFLSHDEAEMLLWWQRRRSISVLPHSPRSCCFRWPPRN